MPCLSSFSFFSRRFCFVARLCLREFFFFLFVAGLTFFLSKKKELSFFVVFFWRTLFQFFYYYHCVPLLVLLSWRTRARTWAAAPTVLADYALTRFYCIKRFMDALFRKLPFGRILGISEDARKFQLHIQLTRTSVYRTTSFEFSISVSCEKFASVWPSWL